MGDKIDIEEYMRVLNDDNISFSGWCTALNEALNVCKVIHKKKCAKNDIK